MCWEGEKFPAGCTPSEENLFRRQSIYERPAPGGFHDANSAYLHYRDAWLTVVPALRVRYIL